MTMAKNLEQIAEQVVAAWQASGLRVPQSDLKLIRKAIGSDQGLSTKLTTRLCELGRKTPLSSTRPDWLSNIDEFFDQPADVAMPVKSKRSLQYRSAFAAVIEAVLPLLSFEWIIQMKSFDDDFIRRVEIGFLTVFGIPRDVEEARRIHETILALPKCCTANSIAGELASDQPFKAQMMLAVLISGAAQASEEIHATVRAFIEKCPDDLLAIPGHDDAYPKSSRPSFWMAHTARGDLRGVLRARGSAQLQHDIGEVTDLERARTDSHARLVSVDSSIQTFAVDELPPEQRELGQLLLEFDEYLMTHAKDVHESLRPGVHHDQIEKLNNELLPLRLPDDLVVLYKWHNGVTPGKYFLDSPEFLGIEDALMEYRQTLEIMSQYSWCRAWLPVGYSNRVFRLVTLSEEACDHANVLGHDVESGDVEVCFESVLSMMKTYFDAYKQGVIYYDSESEQWDIDLDRFENIRLRHNPDSRSYDFHDVTQWPQAWQRFHVGNSGF